MDPKTKANIINSYQRGRNSIQDLARIYKVSVQDVLETVGEGSATKVVAQGDLIDQQEAGNEVPVVYSKEFRPDFSVD